MRLGSLTRSYKAEEMSDAGRCGVASRGDGDAEIRITLSYVPYQGAFDEKEAAGAVGVVLYCGVVML
jgi:hypothetical protein